VNELAQVGDSLARLQKLIDETVRRSVERVTALPAFSKEMRRIERTVRALEARIARLRGVETDNDRPDSSSRV